MFENNIGDDLKWGEIFYDVLLSTITKTCFTLRSGWGCGWEGSPKIKLTGFCFGRSAEVCGHHQSHILTERIAKYFINFNACAHVSSDNKTFAIFKMFDLMLIIKLQCWILHSPWRIATGSTGWRSKRSWRTMLRTTESLRSTLSVVCREHGGRCQRGRLLQGGVAGSTYGVNQPA